MLWLQTHFENSHWEALASDLVQIPQEQAELLANDASDAGLSINFIPSILVSKNF
ncbi:hypothetical protein EV05_0144 [Prochlorococcus sp. MIT 0601]|nr:hypothetical protein EV05_0144 [Prochlorococcus sp. MIT 0601]